MTLTWTAPSGRTYRLLLLDTNALSEVVKRPDVERLGLLTIVASEPAAPCFTPYSLAELYDAPDVFEAFIDLFSQVPAFVTKPWTMIVEEELELYGSEDVPQPMLNAFSPLGPDPSYDLRALLQRLFKDPAILAATGDGRHTDAKDVLTTWQANAPNFQPTQPVANAVDADRFVGEAFQQSLIRLAPEWYGQQLEVGVVPDIERFPTIATLLYNQYWRLWDASWAPATSALFDVQIMAIAPYVDMVVTERFQAEIFRKIGKRVRGLDSLEVLTLKGLRETGKQISATNR